MNEEDRLRMLGSLGLLAPRYPVASLGTATGASNPASASAAEGYAGALGFNIGPRGGLVYRPWEMETWRDTGIPMELWNANLPGGAYGGSYGGGYGAGGLLGQGTGLAGLTPEQIAALTGGSGLPKNWQDYLDWVKDQGTGDKGDKGDKGTGDKGDKGDKGTGDKGDKGDKFTPPEPSFLPNQREYTDHHDWFMNAPYEEHHVGTHEAALRRLYESEGGDGTYGADGYQRWFMASKPQRDVIANLVSGDQVLPTGVQGRADPRGLLGTSETTSPNALGMDPPRFDMASTGVGPNALGMDPPRFDLGATTAPTGTGRDPYAELEADFLNQLHHHFRTQDEADAMSVPAYVAPSPWTTNATYQGGGADVMGRSAFGLLPSAPGIDPMRNFSPYIKPTFTMSGADRTGDAIPITAAAPSVATVAPAATTTVNQGSTGGPSASDLIRIAERDQAAENARRAADAARMNIAPAQPPAPTITAPPPVIPAAPQATADEIFNARHNALIASLTAPKGSPHSQGLLPPSQYLYDI